MNYEYFKTLYMKMKKYNKKATNPFLDKGFEYNPNCSIFEQTYVWVEKIRNK